METTYIIWRLVDTEQNLWLPSEYHTFDQAADAWLAELPSGAVLRITEVVPIVLRDARQGSPNERPREQRATRGTASLQIRGIELPSHSQLRDKRSNSVQALRALYEAREGTWLMPPRVGSTLSNVASRWPHLVERQPTVHGSQYRLTDEGRAFTKELLTQLFGEAPSD